MELLTSFDTTGEDVSFFLSFAICTASFALISSADTAKLLCSLLDRNITLFPTEGANASVLTAANRIENGATLNCMVEVIPS